MEVNKWNKRPAHICDSPATEVNELYATSCKGLVHALREKDPMNVSEQKKETSVAAYLKTEPLKDEGYSYLPWLSDLMTNSAI